MEDIKIFGSMIGMVILIVGLIVGIVGGAVYVSNKKDDAILERSIQCRASGGTMSYESYSWICK